jgi:biotin carboxylase
LKEVGARVTGIGHTPQAGLPARLKYHLDAYARAGSLLDAGSVLEAVRSVARGQEVDLLETGDEALVLTAAMVRTTLGIPGQSVRSAQLCRDKPAMKEALRQAGLPTAASAAVRSMAELSAFVEREGFPVILKPRSALGGLGTQRADTPAELERAARALGIHRGKEAAVEEFVEGHEGFYDTLCRDGEVLHEFISHYYPPVLQALGDRRVAPQIAATNRVNLSSYDELKEMGRKAIKVLGIETGATHMEWFFGPKGLKFSEIGSRPPGERIWDLYSVGNEMDLYREWAMVVTHRRRGQRPSRRFATGSVQVRPERDGRIAGYEGLRTVAERIKPFVTEHLLPEVGTPTDPIHKGYYNNVWFRLRHPDYDELVRLMDFIGETLKVRAV